MRCQAGVAEGAISDDFCGVRCAQYVCYDTWNAHESVTSEACIRCVFQLATRGTKFRCHESVDVRNDAES